MKQTKNVILDNRYRFMEGENRTAVLDANGKLTVFDNGMVVWDTWRSYVKEVMEEEPTTEGEDAIVEQLSMFLGTPQVINEKVSGHEGQPKPKKEEDDMKNATYFQPVSQKFRIGAQCRPH